AEDGIRDDLVTGVQTCALPIYWNSRCVASAGNRRRQLSSRGFVDADRVVVALVRHLRQGLRESDGGFERRAHVQHSRSVHRGNAAWNLSGNDGPDRYVPHAGSLSHGPGPAWIKQIRMAGKMIASIHNMLALINPVVLPALRIAATFFFIMYLLFGAYIFRNRHRFFDRDPSVDNDIPAVRKVRIEVVMIPWLGVTTLILILL